MIRAILLFLLVTSPSVSYAADWAFVTISSKKAIIVIDKSSIRDQREGYSAQPVKIAWFKFDHSQNKSVVQRESKILFHFKCSTSEMKLAQWVDYNSSGAVIDSGSGASYSTYSVAVPDSVGYSMLEAACNDDVPSDAK